jgi:hypothetical protein
MTEGGEPINQERSPMTEGGEPINQQRSPMTEGGEPINQQRSPMFTCSQKFFNYLAFQPFDFECT